MSIASQGGIFSFAVQAAKVGKAGTFSHGDYDWYQMRAPRVAMGTVQQQTVLPPELGGVLTPTGAYKAGYFFAGDVDMLPRAEGDFGWMLLAAMGSVSTVTGVDEDANAVVGLNTHIFSFDPADPSGQPWCAARRLTPGVTTGENFGEAGFDCKVNMLRFTIPAAGKIVAKIQMVGRDIELDDASTWSYANSFESGQSIPDAGGGIFELNGVEYPIVGATIDIANGLSTPQQEAIIGDFRPDDFIALFRSMTIRMVYKYENSELYRQLLTGTVDGTAWSPLPYELVTDGAGHAFDARFEAPIDIGATNYPYKLIVRANRVVWGVEGPPELAAGGIITQALVGSVVTPDSGAYVEVVLVNDQADYVVS